MSTRRAKSPFIVDNNLDLVHDIDDSRDPCDRFLRRLLFVETRELATENERSLDLKSADNMVSSSVRRKPNSQKESGVGATDGSDGNAELTPIMLG